MVKSWLWEHLLRHRVIGKAIGEGNMAVVKEDAKRLQKMFVAIGIISGALLFALRYRCLASMICPKLPVHADSFSDRN
jgi:hypothetical protein